MQKALWTIVSIWLQLPIAVWSHARLMIPPSRSSMWRLGFPTKRNFNDNALYCGGIQIQWQRNGGKCGICGDPYNMPHPRDNEAGGKYGEGIISGHYLPGQIMDAVVDVTTNHRGYFEFKVCPNNNPKKEATQECLDKYPLKLAQGGGTKYYIANKGNGGITVKLQLPKGLSCSQCVFQWTYVAGNNWGRCEDGQSRLGCGPQETFRGCADIAIGKSYNRFPYSPNQNDIRNKYFDFSPFSKSTKQKYSKDTSITKHPKYALEISKQSQRNKSTNTNKSKYSKTKVATHPSSWLNLQFGEKSTASPKLQNETSQKPIFVWKYQKPQSYFNSFRETHSSSTQNTATLKPDIFFTGLSNSGDDLKESELSKILQQDDKEIRLLKFYLQNPRASNSRNVTRGFTLNGRSYKDFWFL
ncbi:hypothetical protein AVEN_111649-1 [Araneus ventricosus]|uniref:Chitin-binding type-4 domain-containing protein n=1 Tax=Araneus ventricosus TaxID=182803 RepID=A0A4Y2C344_ARAVE|nr:hypothetical protein AVEN_111649-1 [Araneus ventricosus]